VYNELHLVMGSTLRFRQLSFPEVFISQVGYTEVQLKQTLSMDLGRHL